MAKIWAVVKLIGVKFGAVFKFIFGKLGALVKFLLPKTIWGWLALAAVILVACFLFGMFGDGFGTGEGDGNSKVEAEQNKETSNVPDVVPESQTLEETPDVYEGAVFKVSVVETDYFYDNERIGLEALVTKLQAVEGDLMVEVVDDNASLKAYNKLLDKLDELDIDYTEK